MKKNFNKLIGIAFIFIAATGIFFSISFARSSSVDLDAALLEKGYPQVVLDSMDEDAKTDIYNEGNITFCGAVISFFDKTGSVLSEVIVSTDGSYAVPVDQIDHASLSLSLVCSQVFSPQVSEPGQIKVTYSYEWLSLPLYRGQDRVCVLWDDSTFKMLDDNFSKTDKYDGYITIGGIIVGKAANRIHSSENAYAAGGPTGAAWYADLKGYLGVWPSALYGYGTFKLVPASAPCSNSLTLQGRYLHLKKMPESRNTVITPDNLFTSGGREYDKYENQLTISW